MISKTIIGLLIVLIGCSGNQQTPISGLRIENSPNRGLNYTDPVGTKYSYRNIPITITNDSTIAIHIKLALSNEYDYPSDDDDQKFKVFLLPKELTPDKVTWDSLSGEVGNNELRNFFEKGLNFPYILNETLEPGEKCDITMGTLYPRPTDCGVVPNALFIQNNIGLYNACERLLNQDISIPIAPEKNQDGTQFNLELKLGFCDRGCFIIPCGQISYPER